MYRYIRFEDNTEGIVLESANKTIIRMVKSTLEFPKKNVLRGIKEIYWSRSQNKVKFLSSDDEFPLEDFVHKYFDFLVGESRFDRRFSPNSSRLWDIGIDVLHEPGKHFTFFSDSGELISYMHIRPRHDGYAVSKLFVIGKYHRKGIGTSMLDLATKINVESGYKKLYISVFKNNKPAYELYRKLGFIEDLSADR